MNNSSPERRILHQDSVSLDSYEEMAEHYSEDVATMPWNTYYERPATISLLPDVNAKRVVEAGCSAGWYTRWLLDHGASVIALDFSPRMIEMTRKAAAGQAEARVADLNQPLDFIEGTSADVVLSSLTLHYLKHWGPVMGEFHRILKKGGYLVFSVHHPLMDFTNFKRENYFLTELLNDEFQTPDGKVKVQFYRRPLNQIINSVTDAGFTIEKLLEPLPTEQFKLVAGLKAYEYLSTRPHFLFIRARKPPR